MFRKLDETCQKITIFVDGQPATAEDNESVAAVLTRQPAFWSRTTPNSNAKRAPYCMMGVCFECLATVDGVSSTQTCLVRVRESMRVERQVGKRKVI